MLASCGAESEQYCEIVDYHNNYSTDGWSEVGRKTTNLKEEGVIFNRFKDGYWHKRVVECADLY